MTGSIVVQPSRLRRAGETPARQHRGFSLLEVVLALAILTAAMTACLQLVRIGMVGAREARDQTRAQEIAESIMGLVTAGIVFPEDLQGERQEIAQVWEIAGMAVAPVGSDLELEESDWVFSFASEPTIDTPDMLKLTVVVGKKAATAESEDFVLTRWIRDPAATQALEDATLTEEQM